MNITPVNNLNFGARLEVHYTLSDDRINPVNKEVLLKHIQEADKNTPRNEMVKFDNVLAYFQSPKGFLQLQNAGEKDDTLIMLKTLVLDSDTDADNIDCKPYWACAIFYESKEDDNAKSAKLAKAGITDGALDINEKYTYCPESLVDDIDKVLKSDN